MIITPLQRHQTAALQGLARKEQCALFMFLGSGKSLVALAQAEKLGAKRILITSDKNNVVNTWPDQVYRHTDFNVEVRPKLSWFNAATFGDHFLNGVQCVCVNYEMLSSRWKEYGAVKWDMWIGDESSEFKDQRTRKHQRLKYVTRNIPYKVILNGKAMTERLEDLYGQFAVLCGDDNPLGHTLSQFRTRYMRPDPMGYKWIPKRSAYTRVQKAVKDVSYWQEDDGSVKMPESEYYRVEVDMTKEQRRLDDELQIQFAASFKGDKIETDFAAVVFTKRVQLCGGIFRGDTPSPVPTEKLDVLRRLIQDNRDSQIVVWHTYIPETSLLSEHLKRWKIPHRIVDSPEAVASLGDSHTWTRGSRVCLIRTSLCRGLNQLVGADLAVYWSNPFSYARRAQSEGRTRRLTSTVDVTRYVDLTTKGGADEIVYHMLRGKKSMSLTMDALRSILTGSFVRAEGG